MLVQWVVAEVMELVPVMAATAVRQKLNREAASCCVAHMVYERGGETGTRDVEAGREWRTHGR